MRRFDRAAIKPPLRTLLILGKRSLGSEQQRSDVRFAPVGGHPPANHLGALSDVTRRGVLEQLGSSDASITDLDERFRMTLDYLVNNAGTSHHQSIIDTTESEMDALYNVHLKGVFFLTQKLLPVINDGGRIVNISSGLVRITSPPQCALCCDERRGGSADPLHGQGAGSARHRGQHRCTGRDPDGFQ